MRCTEQACSTDELKAPWIDTNIMDEVVYVATTSGGDNQQQKNHLEPSRLTRLQQRESRAFLDDVVEVSSSVGSVAGNQMDLDMEEIETPVIPLSSTERKGKKKASAPLEKQAKKQKLAEEKAEKKLADDRNKIYKPGECMKYMSVEGESSLLSRWYMSDVSREVSAAGARLAAAALCEPALLVWSRATHRVLRNYNGEVKLTPSQEPCHRALYIASAEELCELVSSHTLATHLSRVRELCDRQLTLVVFKAHDYFKSTRRKTSNSNRTPMTEIEFELAITDLLVTADCDTVIVNTPNELALLIVQFTKAIAEAPFKKAKRACDEQADFFMRGDNKKCVAIDKDGVGVGRVWQQMIAILPQSSLETSRALCAQYKSPLDLYESLQSSNGIADVANIGVSRTAVAGSKARRLGPEFTRKLHTLFTSTRGDVLID